MVDDTDRRMESLFDRLGNKLISSSVLAPTFKIIKGKIISMIDSLALESRDFVNAKQSVTNLMTIIPEDDTKWIVGLKRLIELYEQC